MCRPCVVCVVLLAAPTIVQAQSADAWLGKDVVQKSFRLRLAVTLSTKSGVIVPRGLEIYRVEEVNGSLLRLRGPIDRGWADAVEVVDVDEAIDYYTKYIRVKPGDDFGYSMRSMIWRQVKNDLDHAMRDADQALQLSPTAATFVARGVVCVEKKEFDKGIADFTAALRRDPKFVPGYLARGDALRVKKALDRATADFSEAIRLLPKDARAYSGRGWVSHLTRNYQGAIDDYADAIRINPLYPDAYNNRAWTLATAVDANFRNGKAAVEAAFRACDLSRWKHANHIDTLAAACAELGEFDSAIKWETRALELQTDEPTKAEYRERLKLYEEKKPYRDDR